MGMTMQLVLKNSHGEDREVLVDDHNVVLLATLMGYEGKSKRGAWEWVAGVKSLNVHVSR